ncbi:chondroitin sulfate proteoglycan 4-like [Talpa occidentalis]|uniref:chondroitin sulfate proteoglycan 4-like n=1 Tax=Talpa occidentalis TaxID=50954 RepID=UPI00188FF20D|nr:chondroitin sulfate proteoglycan 4-like [Talpa occidentalis]
MQQLDRSLVGVSDNKWHAIQLKLTGRYLDLMVDKQGVRMLPPLQSKPFVSEGPFSMGGVECCTWTEVKRLKLASVPKKYLHGISFKGCLKGLKANSKRKALKDGLVSRDISAGCKTKSIDNENPSTTTKNLLQSEVSLSTAVPKTGKPFVQDMSSYFLVLNNLEVQEGGQALLAQRHMKVDVKLKILGIHHSQILCKIKEMPAHGYLRLEVLLEQEMEKAFTMLDLGQRKVWYVHNGSEESRDYFTFAVFFNIKKDMLLNPHHVAHVFNIIVIPVNDLPYLKLPAGNLLVLFENSKKRLTSNTIHESSNTIQGP